MQAVIGGPVKHLELHELHTLCIEKGGSELSRLLLVTRLLEYFGNTDLSSPGCIIPDQDEGDSDIAVAKLKKKIHQEVNSICLDRNNYDAYLNYDNASKYASSTVLIFFPVSHQN